MIDIKNLKTGQRIKYVGKNTSAYHGSYKLYKYEDSYVDKNNCPEQYRNALCIYIETPNDFIITPVDILSAEDWKLVE